MALLLNGHGDVVEQAAGAVDRQIERAGLADHGRQVDGDRRAAGPSGKVIRESGDV